MAAALGELKQKLGYVSDQNISGPVPTERTAAPPQPRRNPYRKLLWLIPSAFILLLVGTLAIYAAVAWLLVPAQVDDTVPTGGKQRSAHSDKNARRGIK